MNRELPPLSSSGVPPWLVERFPDPDLTEDEKTELRELMEAFVTDAVTRFRGRMTLHDATNETLQPFTQWYIGRLGPGIAPGEPISATIRTPKCCREPHPI